MPARAGRCRRAPPPASLGPRAAAPRAPPQSPWASRGGRRYTVRPTACSSRAPLLSGPSILREGRARCAWPPSSPLRAILRAPDACFGDLHPLDDDQFVIVRLLRREPYAFAALRAFNGLVVRAHVVRPSGGSSAPPVPAARDVGSRWRSTSKTRCW